MSGGVLTRRSYVPVGFRPGGVLFGGYIRAGFCSGGRLHSVQELNETSCCVQFTICRYCL